MSHASLDRRPPSGRGRFQDPEVTATGEPRAEVALTRLETLWFNTGSLCNITCDNCYIESSPLNDRLSYLTPDDVRAYLDEVAEGEWPLAEVGLTGGEPFLNRDLTAILEEILGRGHRVLILTNAMKPMHRRRPQLLVLRERYDAALGLRVSIDHFTPEKHEAVRGPGTWAPMFAGLRWLCANGFQVSVASRTLWHEPEADVRTGFAGLFAAEGLALDALDPARLVLFPEMDLDAAAPEITTRCWGILGVAPEQMMCATSRMVLKRKGAALPVVVPCTLLPYDPQFELGHRLSDAKTTVKLNHPFCAQFCVLGGASCSGG